MRLHALALLGALAAAPPPAAGAPADARSLREADAALARALAGGDRGAFAALLAEDTCFSDGGRPLVGRAAVVAAWDELFAKDGPRLTWEPELAELSTSGDLGYTAGSYRLEATDAAGAPVVRTGRYVTVWRREADGAYRALADAPLRPPADGESAGLLRARSHRHVSRDGDLVVELGTYARAGSDRPAGTWLSVLRRARDGALALALDTLSPAPPAAE
jgi:ketosteroid isomerase-like protein